MQKGAILAHSLILIIAGWVIFALAIYRLSFVARWAGGGSMTISWRPSFCGAACWPSGSWKQRGAIRTQFWDVKVLGLGLCKGQQPLKHGQICVVWLCQSF